MSARKFDAVVAVGSKLGGTAYNPIIEKWDGLNWKLKGNPSVAANAELFGVTTVPSHAPNTDTFWAVGYNEGTNRDEDPTTGQIDTAMAKTLIERSTDDGETWTVIFSPNPDDNPPGSDTNILEAVTSADANTAWAVGYHRDNITGVAQPLIEQWDGTQWSIVTDLPELPPGDNYLYGVDASSSTDVWAVGYNVATSGPSTILFLHWDGTKWFVGDHDAPGTFSRLFGVECLSGSKCWASGIYRINHGIYLYTLAEKWDPTSLSWSRVDSPNYPQSNFFYGVRSIDPDWTWMVGSHGPDTLIEKWDGTQWKIVVSPSPGANNQLRSVTVVPGTKACAGGDSWAVGNYRDPTSNVRKTLTERYTISPCTDP